MNSPTKFVYSDTVSPKHPPCSVTFCPFSPQSSSLLAVGTYSLLPTAVGAAERRVGDVQLYSLTCDEKLDLLRRFATETEAAVFRLLWSANSAGSPVLYGALTSGQLAILTGFEGAAADVQHRVVQVCKDGAMLLSLSLNGGGAKTCLCGTSSGCLVSFDLCENREIRTLFGAHKLSPYSRAESSGAQVWDVVLSRFSSSLAYSGADDGLLKLWDLRDSSPTPIGVNKSHDGGVTQLLEIGDRSLISGAYDEHLRLFDVRNLRSSVDECDVGGGVWAVEPIDERRLLVAAMYGGWRLVEFGGASFGETLAGDGSIGDNLLYGASKLVGRRSFVLCTFNDGKLISGKLTSA